MAMTRKEEARALDAEERDLVARSHHSAVQTLDDADLAQLKALIRTRRDRARSLAHQKRREMRGKAAPRGAEVARADAGSSRKVEALAAAMRRLNVEHARRGKMRARMTLIANQQRALMMAQGVEWPHESLNTRTAHAGMRAVANTRIRRIGSAREAGRVSQFVRNAQARRDAR